MSTVHRAYIGGVQKEGVLDLESREIERNYDRDKNTVFQQTNIGTIRLSREANDALLEYLAGGIDGSTPGALEGLSYAEEIERNGVVERIFDGYMDLTETHTLSKIQSEVVVKEKDSVDFLNDVVDQCSFEYLESIGKITAADYEWMPYILNSVPDYPQAATAMLSVYVVAEQVKTVIQQITAIGVEMTNPFEVTAIVRMVIYIAYLIGLFIALAKLVKDIVQLLIQPVKYHACMSMRKHLEIAAAHLGYGFECPFFDDPRWSTIHWMPEKYFVKRNTTDNRILGFLNPDTIEQKGYYKGLLGDAFRAAKTIFRGKFVVSATKIILIREDQGVGIPEYRLAHEGDSNYWQPEYEINADEFISNYVISFETDISDKNTIQEYQGTSVQVVASPIVVNDQKSVLMKNLYEARIPFALAKRKEELTVPEKIIKAFLDAFSDVANALIDAVNVVIDVYNAIVGTINKIINALDFIGIDVNWEIPSIPPIEPLDLGSLIENRIGMMKIEYDQFNVPKMFMMSKSSVSHKYNKIHPDNATALTARKLWDEFHYISSFVPTPDRPNGNQAVRVRYNYIPFTFEDDQKVKRNNRIYDYNGVEQELLSLKYLPVINAADVYVRESRLWTKNIKETIIEPNGA